MPLLKKAQFNWLKSYKTSDACSFKKIDTFDSMKQNLWKSGIKNALQWQYLKQPSTTLVFNTALVLIVRLEYPKACNNYLHVLLFCLKKPEKEKPLVRINVKPKHLPLQLKKSPLKSWWEISNIKLATKIIIVIPTSTG